MSYRITFYISAWILGCLACTPPSKTHKKSSNEAHTAVDSAMMGDIPSPARTVNGTIDGVAVTINYSSPGVRNRTIWGDLEPYGEVWRTGANAATTISFDQAVSVQGQRLAAGKYALFTIPYEDSPWEVIFNKEWDQWGAYNYDINQDEVRVEVEPIALETIVERLRFDLDEDAQKIILSWEKIMLPIDISALN